MLEGLWGQSTHGNVTLILNGMLFHNHRVPLLIFFQLSTRYYTVKEPEVEENWITFFYCSINVFVNSKCNSELIKMQNCPYSLKMNTLQTVHTHFNYY